MALKLSSRQLNILEFIKQEIKVKGYPPTVREIGEAVGLASSSTVHGHLDRLEKRGLIRRDPTKPRALELLYDYGNQLGKNASLEENVKVPVLGRVTAGEPILAVEDVEEYFVLPESMVGGDTIYMLRIQGSSMINAGILDGDFVIVRKQEIASNGDIVVAMTEENEATVKRFFKEKGHFRLQPENPSMDPILLPVVTILGKVIGVFRQFQ